MADLDQLRHPDNLRRAWRWLRSNPDAAYKSYFRSLYQRFAIAEESLIDDLADRLKRGIYEPGPATKRYEVLIRASGKIILFFCASNCAACLSTVLAPSSARILFWASTRSFLSRSKDQLRPHIGFGTS